MAFRYDADNQTPMTVRCAPMDDRHGRHVLVIIAKMAWDVSAAGRCRALVGEAPIRLTDVPAYATAGASIRHPSDLFDEKPGACVILVATAYPPADRAVTEQDVSVRVEAGRRTLEKSVRVYGPRVWYEGVRGVVPGPAARLAPTPIRYESTFGGSDHTDPGRILVERRNPCGSGVAAHRARLVGTAAPAIEDPRHPLASLSPAPAGFGPIAPGWSPRVELAGTHDETWRRERAPLRPDDFDPRHNCCSEPDLWSEETLRGDEPVEVRGATPSGVWRFRLPRYTPIFEIETTSGKTELRPGVDTFLIDAEEGRVELTWRTRVPIPRKPDRVEAVRVLDDGEPRELA